MITQSIKAPSFLTRVANAFVTGLHSPRQEQQPVRQPMQGFDKRRYSLYLETILKRFQRGDYVTYASVPVTQDMPPAALYKIVYIQELWYEVEFDHLMMEPKAILLMNINYRNSPMVPAIASRLRQLTKEELTHVDLQH